MLIHPLEHKHTIQNVTIKQINNKLHHTQYGVNIYSFTEAFFFH